MLESVARVAKNSMKNSFTTLGPARDLYHPINHVHKNIRATVLCAALYISGLSESRGTDLSCEK